MPTWWQQPSSVHHHCCLSQSALAGSLSWEPGWILSPDTSTWNVQFLKMYLLTCLPVSQCHKKKNGNKRQRILYLLLHCPNGYNGQDGPSWSQGPKSFSWVSYLGGRELHSRAISCCFFQAISREVSWKCSVRAWAGDHMGCWCHTVPQGQPSMWEY